MQRTVQYPPLTLSEQDATSSLNIVIAYEDFEAGKHAKSTYDFLEAQLGREFQISNQMWKFDVLCIPKLREMAAKDAAMADIIIISSRGGELGSEVKTWIETWMSRNSQVLAMVVLFTGGGVDPRERNATREYLFEMARLGRMEFFAQPDDWPGRHNGQEQRLNCSTGTFKALSTLAGAVEHDVYPRWGINE